ncbi:MAG: hypothetical protein RLZZ299_2575 [Pseudomonadota bacterium]|jgi:hypothetical protein
MALALACSAPMPGDTGASGPSFSYPLDDVLRVSDLQAVGTHNSYHLRATETTLAAWDYAHPPLDAQAETLGVRQFELDLERGADGAWQVFHIAGVDDASNCPLLTDCLATLHAWSRAHPGHHPMLVLLELKSPFDAGRADDDLASLEDAVASAWDRDALLTPDDVRGDAENLRDAIAGRGWPTLGETRGRTLFVLHVGGAWRDRYLGPDGATDGRILFPDAYDDLYAPWAAYHSMNDPLADRQRIAGAVALGHLVRTRADVDGAQARANDPVQRDAALESGAHFVSTDFPAPHPDTGYVVRMPGGSPSRCNPLRAPDTCVPGAVEAPDQLGG